MMSDLDIRLIAHRLVFTEGIIEDYMTDTFWFFELPEWEHGPLHVSDMSRLREEIRVLDGSGHTCVS